MAKEKRNEILYVRVYPSTKKRLEKAAKKAKKSLSEYVDERLK